MRKIPLVLFASAALFYGAMGQTSAKAQVRNQTQPYPTQNQNASTPIPTQGLTLEQRYVQCISVALCPLQERLQIVQEEANEMNAHFQKLFEMCAARNFQDCIDIQQAEMDAWHSADYRASQMMLSIQAQSLALKESAAGEPSNKTAAQKRSFWDRLWGK